MLFKTLVAAAIVGFSGVVHAEMKEEGPCAKDRQTFCSGIEHGGGALLKCMKENEPKLSTECKAHHAEMKEHMKDMKDACHADVEKFCTTTKKGGGRLLRCMKEHKDQLSAECKAEIESKKKSFQKSRKGS